MNNHVDVNVCGVQGLVPCTYKTVVLKPNVIDDKNILTQSMMNKPNTKYVIKYDYVIDPDIQTGIASVSESNISHCVNPNYAAALAAYNLAHDAWIDADNAYTNNPNDTTLAAKNAAYAAYTAAQTTLNNTPQFYYYAANAILVKQGQYISIPKGCVLLNASLSGITDFVVAPNDIIVYIGSLIPGTYEYTVQNAIQIPARCLIEFDGGSISDGALVGDETILIFDQEEEVILKNVELLGEFEYSARGSGVDKKDNVDGMATITLKKNKSFASQLTQPNTIYRIIYDFDLGGESVVIPDNCVLDFKGGSLTNGTVVGNNTNINADLVKIFDTNVVINGTWIIDETHPEWFDAKGNGVADDTAAIQKAIDLASIALCKTIIKGGTYCITDSTGWGLVPRANMQLIGVGMPTLILKSPVANIISNHDEFRARPINPSWIHDIIIEGIIFDSNGEENGDPYGKYVPKPDFHPDDVHFQADEFSYGINICYAKNITVRNCKFKNSYYGGVDFFIVDGQNIIDCTFENIGMYPDAHYPGYAAFGTDGGNVAGIDTDNSNIFISGCLIENCSYVYRFNMGAYNNHNGGICENYTFTNNVCRNCNEGIIGFNGTFKHVIITNNQFEEIKSRVIAITSQATSFENVTGYVDDVLFANNYIHVKNGKTGGGLIYTESISDFKLYDNTIIVEQSALVRTILAPDTSYNTAYSAENQEAFKNKNVIIKGNSIRMNAMNKPVFSANIKLNVVCEDNYLNITNTPAFFEFGLGRAEAYLLVEKNTMVQNIHFCKTDYPPQRAIIKDNYGYITHKFHHNVAFNYRYKLELKAVKVVFTPVIAYTENSRGVVTRPNNGFDDTYSDLGSLTIEAMDGEIYLVARKEDQSAYNRLIQADIEEFSMWYDFDKDRDMPQN